ncbi:MAG TPA: MarR family transcriptional regulator [Polyangia bacterium]
MAEDPLMLEAQLCFALYSTSLAMTKVYKPLLESLGITYPQYLVMLVLWEEDRIPLKTISDRLHQDPGALTPVVKRLEAEGYLRRKRSTEDERNLAIELTEKGRALRHKGTKVNAAIFRACGMDDGELARLRRSLFSLRERLET